MADQIEMSSAEGPAPKRIEQIEMTTAEGPGQNIFGQNFNFFWETSSYEDNIFIQH